MKKVFACLVFISLFSLFIIPEALAVGIGPTSFYFTATPGETITGSINVTNTQKTPFTLVVGTRDFWFDATTKANQYVDESLEFGLKEYLTWDTTEQLANPNENKAFNFTIKIPENAANGTYSTSALATTKIPGAEGTGVGMSAGAVSKIFINIGTNIKEELSIDKFTINEEKLKAGQIVYDLTIKNTGNAFSAPIGDVTVYNDKGEQLKGIYPIIKKFEGKDVVTSREDKIPVNKMARNILPNNSKDYEIPLITNTTIEAGTYTAKLDMFYGLENSKDLKSETTFTISKDFVITAGAVKFTEVNNTYPSLPANFKVSIKNEGNIATTATGYIEITNAFGGLKARIDMEQQDLASGEEKTVDLVWDKGFALGQYNAKAFITMNETTYTDTLSFWVINWISIGVISLIVIVIIVLLVLAFKSYLKLKKRLAKLEKK